MTTPTHLKENRGAAVVLLTAPREGVCLRPMRREPPRQNIGLVWESDGVRETDNAGAWTALGVVVNGIVSRMGRPPCLQRFNAARGRGFDPVRAASHARSTLPRDSALSREL
jgi:hypothetical protein